MSFSIKRSVLASSSASLLLCAFGGPAWSQDASGATALPEIHVTAPSPIQHRRAVVPSPRPARVAQTIPTRNRERTPRPQAAPRPQPAAVVAAAPPAPQPGILPIVTDQFATVTVVPSDEIRRSGASTLGDLLLNKPGITGSSFAPGASSRPIKIGRAHV